MKFKLHIPGSKQIEAEWKNGEMVMVKDIRNRKAGGYNRIQIMRNKLCSSIFHQSFSISNSNIMMNPNPDPSKHKDIPIWNAEDWFYEDIQIGKRIRSIRRTISEGESMQFNALVLDMHPYVATIFCA